MQIAYSLREMIICFKRVLMTKVTLECIGLSAHLEILLALAAKVAMCRVNCRSLVQVTVGMGSFETFE